MPYLYVENFEAGLDTRKSAFTAPPGSLRVLRNAHITRGKEIERRKAFALFATLPAGTVGLHAVQDRLFTFGSTAEPAEMPPTVEYQQLEDPGGGVMTRLLSAENFDGRIYAVAEYDSGAVQHFYDGSRVTDWNTIAQDLGTEDLVAEALGSRVDEDGALDAVVVGPRIILTATTPGAPVNIVANGAGLSVTVVQPAQSAAGEVPAAGGFDVVAGSPGQTFNTVSLVAIDGVDLIGSPVDFDTDVATTAQAVADRINSGTSGYQASSAGGRVDIQATPGLGASANGRTLEVGTEGDVQVSNIDDLSGGTDPIPAVPQITHATVTAYDAATTYQLEVEGEPYRVTGESAGMPRSVRAVKQKMYAVVSSLLYFSGFSGTAGLADPTQWDNSESNDTGAGFINMSTQYSGSEELVGIGVYQGRVAAFSRRSVQIWNVDPDPSQNSPYQVLLNVGSIAPNSIVEYGDLDIFFLSESGVRSLRARDSSNLASANDVGVAIDADVNRYVASIDRRSVREAKAVVEPEDSRYLLAIGERVYVFSNFPGSRVAAWSTYDLDAPVEAWAVAQSRLYARVGDTVRLYGGLSGQEYDTSETEVVLPFLDASNPAGVKQIRGMDIGSEGTWLLEMALEPNNPEVFEVVHHVTEGSYGSMGRLSMQGISTHVSMRATTRESGPALLGNLIVHYDDIEAG